MVNKVLTFSIFKTNITSLRNKILLLMKLIIYSDFLWADPCENDEEAVAMEWSDNVTRGCSYVFGYKKL